MNYSSELNKMSASRSNKRLQPTTVPIPYQVVQVAKPQPKKEIAQYRYANIDG